MNKVALMLRKAAVPNRFREIILACFKNPAFDDLLLCSGFFQERGTYSASDCFIAAVPSAPCRKSITLVGVYSAIWRPDFDVFAGKLTRIAIPGVVISVTRRRVPRLRWHAKVFVANTGSTPKVALIGSSNMTVRAFGVRADWNYEADVVIWDSRDVAANEVVVDALQRESDDRRTSIIVSDYSETDSLNGDMELIEKVRSLVDAVLNSSSSE